MRGHDRQDALSQDHINSLWGELALLDAKLTEQEEFKSCKSS